MGRGATISLRISGPSLLMAEDAEAQGTQWFTWGYTGKEFEPWSRCFWFSPLRDTKVLPRPRHSQRVTISQTFSHHAVGLLGVGDGAVGLTTCGGWCGGGVCGVQRS